MTLNGSAAISGSYLQLTNGQTGEASSAYFSTPVNVAQFSTQFTFQLINANADGFTFTIQNDGKTALGPGGGGLGYGWSSGGIPNSVAVKFDLYNNQGEGNDSTGLYTDGAAPTNVGSINLSSTGINLHSGDVFQATLSYYESTLTETIADTRTNATVTETYTINIAQTVGSSTAYVGFTAGTGGLTATQDVLQWTYSAGSQVPSAPANLVAAASGTGIGLSWTATAGATSYNVYRGTSKGGEGTAPYATGITTTSYTDSSVTAGATYYYYVVAVNSFGQSTPSAEASATAAAPAINFGSGFAGSQSQLALNGSAAISGSYLQLTNGQTGEASSAYFSTPVSVAQFSTQFTFQLTNANADGFTFTIQNDGTTALGGGGGGLGYGAGSTGGTGGIPNSVAVKFDLYSNQGEGNDSTGLYTDGAAPTNVGSINLSSTGINLHSGDVFQATLSYNGSTLTETITDTQTNATVTETYTINIPQTVGSSTAYVGFTAGTGGLTATQNILQWSYFSGSQVPSPPGTLTAAASGTSIALSWSSSAGATSYDVYRGTSKGGETTAPLATGITTTSFMDSTVTPGTTYYYIVTAVNSFGQSTPSAEASAAASGAAPVINFGSGFAGSQSQLALNGSAAISGSYLQLTNGQTGEASSAYFSTPVSVAQFSTQFTFQLTNANADGFTFTIQNDGTTALGGGGGGLGYGAGSTGGTGGIPNSVAVKFDLYSNQGEGNDSTGLYTDGAAPTNVGSINLSSTGINLHSGDVFQATLSYNGSTLTETITDTQTNATVTETYTINIPQTVGSSTAYVGFTAGTGGLTATQNILEWTYSAASQVPTAPGNLMATASGTTIGLTWASVAGATSYNIYRGASAGGEGTTAYQTGVTATGFSDAGLATGTTYYYFVTAVNGAGESSHSAETSATTVPPVPTNLVATTSGSTIGLSWTASSKAVTYNIYRGTTASGEGTTAYKTGITATTFSDPGLATGTTYYYFVTAVNGGR